MSDIHAVYQCGDPMPHDVKPLSYIKIFAEDDEIVYIVLQNSLKTDLSRHQPEKWEGYEINEYITLRAIQYCHDKVCDTVGKAIDMAAGCLTIYSMDHVAEFFDIPPTDYYEGPIC